MQAPIKKRKKRGKLYFSSTKALKSRRMGRKKVAPETYDSSGINKVLDFDDNEGNVTLSTIDESQSPSKTRGPKSPCGEASKDMGIQSNPVSKQASQEESGDEDVEETSLMDPEG